MKQIDQFIEFVRDQYKTMDFIPLHEPVFMVMKRNTLWKP